MRNIYITLFAFFLSSTSFSQIDHIQLNTTFFDQSEVNPSPLKSQHDKIQPNLVQNEFRIWKASHGTPKIIVRSGTDSFLLKCKVNDDPSSDNYTQLESSGVYFEYDFKEGHRYTISSTFRSSSSGEDSGYKIYLSNSLTHSPESGNTLEKIPQNVHQIDQSSFSDAIPLVVNTVVNVEDYLVSCNSMSQILIVPYTPFSEGELVFDGFFIEDKGISVEPPEMVKDLSVCDISTNKFNLSWKEPEESSFISGYQIFLNDNLIKTVSGTQTVLNNLSYNTVYNVKVRAIDCLNRVGEPEYIQVRTSDKINIPNRTCDEFTASIDFPLGGQWHLSPGLTILSGQNSNTIVIKLVGDGTLGTIQFQPNDACYETLQIEKYIGEPSTPSNQYIYAISPGNYNFGFHNSKLFYAGSNSEGATTYSWWITSSSTTSCGSGNSYDGPKFYANGNSYSATTSENKIKVDTGTCEGTFYIHSEARNNCGEVSFYSKQFRVLQNTGNPCPSNYKLINNNIDVVRIVPQPCQNLTSFKKTNTEKMKITIYDLYGKVWGVEEEEWEINTAKLKSGFYILKAEVGTEILTYKFIKQ